MNKRGTAKYIWTVVGIVALFSFLILAPKNLLTGNAITGMPVAGGDNEREAVGEACLSDEECQEGLLCIQEMIQYTDGNNIVRERAGAFKCTTPRQPEQPQGGQAQQGVSHSVDEITGLREALGGAGGGLKAIWSPSQYGIMTPEDKAQRESTEPELQKGISRYLSLEYWLPGEGEEWYQLKIRDPTDPNWKGDVEIDHANNAYVANYAKKIHWENVDDVREQLGIKEAEEEVPGSFCVLQYGPSCPTDFESLPIRIDGEDDNPAFCNSIPTLGLECAGGNPIFHFCCKNKAVGCANNSACTGGKICRKGEANQLAKSCAAKAQVGRYCESSAECTTNKCNLNRCQISNVPETCITNSDCTTNKCDTGRHVCLTSGFSGRCSARNDCDNDLTCRWGTCQMIGVDR